MGEKVNVVKSFLEDITNELRNLPKSKEPVQVLTNAMKALGNLQEKDVTDKIFFARGAGGDMNIRADIPGTGTIYGVKARYEKGNPVEYEISQGGKTVYKKPSKTDYK